MSKNGPRTGLNALKARVKVRGLSAIDLRTLAARALVQWREALIRDLGGADSISTQRMTLIELATRTRLFIDHVDAFLLEQSSLVNKSKRAIYPIVAQRQQLVDSLARLLSQLGLDRQAKPVEDLETY
jgi:hypothetical protein